MGHGFGPGGSLRRRRLVSLKRRRMAVRVRERYKAQGWRSIGLGFLLRNRCFCCSVFAALFLLCFLCGLESLVAWGLYGFRGLRGDHS